MYLRDPHNTSICGSGSNVSDHFKAIVLSMLNKRKGFCSVGVLRQT
jgi:hypothetical protein